ncbi:membrane integrity-associated transporter subunit PqiC [Myxococcota bacterium]|jgi:uncharacterized lipoprotein YmbA|nr:membrane integrity-associated transporter subunit PqiC [Myxococcota bacterium]
MLQRILALGILAALLAGQPGCGSAPQKAYFTLSYPLADDRAADSRPPLHPVRMRLRPFEVALPYDRPQMVYRQSPYEFQYDPYRLWATKPQHMLRELVADHLRAARLVEEVTRTYGEEPPPYELKGEVLAIEELDARDAWFGHLAMRFELVRTRDQVTLWHYQFDRKRQVGKQSPALIVRAQSEILQEEMRRVTAELDRAISRDRGVAPTLALPGSAGDAPRTDRAAAGPDAAAPGRPSSPPSGNSPASPDPLPLIVPDEEVGR